MVQIGEVVGETYSDVREAILGLRSGGGGAERRLVDALAEYLARYHEQSGVDVTFDIGDGVSEVRLAPAVEVQLVRIVQESLANVRKHARTAQAVLRLEMMVHPGGPRLRATIEDRGHGFDLDVSPLGAHFGLAIMRERAEGVGGTFAIDSAPGKGTCVIVSMPVESVPAAGSS